jgi:hypothetical protein
VSPSGPGTQGYNPYAYVANNPVTRTDPSGHFAGVVHGEAVLKIGVEVSEEESVWEILAYNAEAEGVTEALAVTGAEVVFMFAVALVVLVAIVAVIWLVNELVRWCMEGGCAKMAGYVEAGVRWTARAGHVAEVGTFLTSVGTATQPQDDPCDDLVWTGENWAPYYGPKPEECNDDEPDCDKALKLIDPNDIGHVLEQHGDFAPERKGQFADQYDIPYWIAAAIAAPDPGYPAFAPPGSNAPCELEKTFPGETIGTTRAGQPSNMIRIFYDFEGNIYTAYPA